MAGVAARGAAPGVARRDPARDQRLHRHVQRLLDRFRHHDGGADQSLWYARHVHLRLYRAWTDDRRDLLRPELPGLDFREPIGKKVVL